MSSASAPAAPSEPPAAEGTGHGHGKLLPLALGALGIVYGDIGTSPLYSIKECFMMIDGKVAPHAMPVNHDSVLGILSLVFWSLTLVVAVKYLSFITRADNKGEGGMFALLALLPDRQRKSTAVVVMAGLFGASLLYGEGIITPGISVLSAVEGLGVAPHAMDQFILPITLVILLGLFLVQKRGTGGIGKVFGPVMAVWFVAISILGVRSIIDY
ncbi:MAG TPA: KUP/HAK/KT family potassium transporter, partial [Archangium sp.]